jgi:hypothetical protein
MEPEKTKKDSSLVKSIILPGCSGCGLGCLSTFGLCLAATAMGFTLLPINTAFLGGLAGMAIVLITAAVARARRKPVPWMIFLTEIAAVAIILPAVFAWDTPRYIYNCIFAGKQPPSINIIRSEYEESIDPSAWIHFNISPTDMLTLIKTSELRLDQHPPKDRYVINGKPTWWNPLELGPNAKHFKKKVYWPDQTNCPQYVAGIWVNAATNEAYGYYLDL